MISGAGIQQVPNLGFVGETLPYLAFQFLIGFGLSLVLPLVLSPRSDQECLQVAPVSFYVPK